MIELLKKVLDLVKPNPEFNEIRLDRKRLRLYKKQLKFAKKLIRQLKRDFRRDGFSDEEKKIIRDVTYELSLRKLELLKKDLWN